METEIQLPAGISLIPAVRKSVKTSDSDFKKNSIGDSSSNTDGSLEELQLSPVKNILKRKHVDDEKCGKKYKINSHTSDDFDDSIDDESESDYETHDKLERDGSREDIPDILEKFGTILQNNKVVLNSENVTVLTKANESSKSSNKDSANDDCGKSNLLSDEKNNDDIEFDITEKLREMGEISVKPVKKGFGDMNAAKKNDTEDEVSVEIATKDGDDEEHCTTERKVGNLRRNIREVMDDQQLDAATLSAQREEMERLARVQEQQKIIREVQRQIALNKHNNKTQTRVLSLLQGNTSLLKQNASYGGPKVPIPGTGTVLVKIPNKGVQKPGPNLTPSISIAPVKSKSKHVGYHNSDSEPDVDFRPIISGYDTKKTKKDVVTIVDSSSDDDCIILSDDEEPEEEPEEDTQNSGLHVNDAYNTPDEQGRVVINIGHPESDNDIFLAPQIARVIKPHQIGGVRFLFDNIIESVERFNSSTGFGCILAHSMGLGKTLQLVCFCDIFLRHTSSKTVLCIMPINTLQNWVAEFNMWLPVDAETSSLRLHGEVRARNFNLHVLNDSHKTLTARAKIIQDWSRDGGVLLIGYELYRLLSLKKMCKPKKRRGKNQAPIAEDPEDIESNKKLLDEMFAALVKPGPDLVICDEGHRIKNSHAGISMALKQIRSKRRIVLTGYPLQNNLQEYWCMVDFVRPNYLGTKTEFANMFERPIQNGQCIDSTPQDIRLMRYRAHVLHSLLLGFVQRRSHAVLQTSLPQKEEYVLMLRMTPFQRKLYDTFMNDVVRKKAVPNALKAFAVCCKIWNHPDVLYHWLRKREADLDLDLDDGSTDTAPNTSANPTTPIKTKKGNAKSRTAGPAKTSRKNKKSQKARAAEDTDSTAQDVKPSATIIPNSINTESTTTNTNSKFFMPNSDNSDNAISFSNMPNERNNTSFPPSRADSGYNYPYPYPQNNYYPPKEEYRSSSQYLPNQQQQFSGDNYNAFPQQQNADTYGTNNSNQYWGQNYYPQNMNQQNPDFNYSTNYSNNMYPSNMYENRYSEFDNLKTDDKSWNNMRFDNMKTEDKNWNIQKSEQKQEIGEGNENCDTNMKIEKKHVFGVNPDSMTMKNEISSLGETPNKMSEDINGSADEAGLDKTLEDTDIHAIKIPAKDEGIPYDWATELLKGYVDGVISNSAKMEIFFCILEESIRLNDRILVFSQSLFTLNLIEDFLQKNVVTGTDVKWARNINYYRLDGSTSALEREKLINEFNANPHIHMFLVSTRAGSLGINLVGANRVIVFDASWNPCHDTQAVCRVYRYGQKKPCFVYRLVMDNCLERKIYDRQINKQGMADRVVDECNPDAHLSMKEVTNLCWDDELDSEVSDFSHAKDKYIDVVMQKVVESFSHALNKEPFQHESLLIDRKEKKLSLAEKRQAQRGYELEKQASTRPAYSYNSGGTMQYRPIRTPDGAIVHRPVASVRPMQADTGERLNTPRSGGARPTRWIPAEVWQRQGMTAQEMTLPLDVVIPTSSTEKANIVLKAGQKVMVLKSPKGIYMQLESGKIIAIKTAFKVGQHNKSRSEGPQDCLPTMSKKSMMRVNPSKMHNNMIPGLPGNIKGSMMQNRNLGSRMNAVKGHPMSMVNMKENSRFNVQSAKIGGMMRKNIQFASAKPYNISRNKPNISSSTAKHIDLYPPAKSNNMPTSIKMDHDASDIKNNKNVISKPDSIHPDDEKSIDSMKETCAKESSLDYRESKCDDFESTLCLESDDHESKNNWLADDVSKLKLDLESENAENTSSSNKSSNSGMSNNNLNLPFEDLNSNLNEDTNDKVTEKEFSDKATNQKITSLKNYRHKSSHKPTAVSAKISNINSQPVEPLSQIEKTLSNASEHSNMFQSALGDITRPLTPKENETKSTEKSNANFFRDNIDLSDKTDQSMESNPVLGTDYSNMQVDNSKSIENVDDKKKPDLLGIDNQNFSTPFSFEKNNTTQESQEDPTNADRIDDPMSQQIHHFPSYSHSDPNAPAQSYSAPYTGYSYPANSVPPYEHMYPGQHSTQYHDPSAYSGLFHGHSAFHRPEPIAVPNQEINPPNFHQQLPPYQLASVPPKPVSYPPVGGVQTYPQQIQNYPPQLLAPQITTPQAATSQIPPQVAPAQMPTSQMPPAHLSPPQLPSAQIPPAQMTHTEISPTQLDQQQPFPNQNPIPNYQLNAPTNGYPNYSNQPIYGQFTENYPNPNPQHVYNARIYPPIEYGSTNFSPGYPSYPGQQANNQWAQ